MSNPKIALFGGTFDPVHNGHIAVADIVLHKFGLDRVVFMPNGNPPHKGKGTAVFHRMNMVRLAIEGINGFEISGYEAEKKGKSYTYQTLEYFKKQYSDAGLFFIAGADNISQIHCWRLPQRIFDLAHIIFAARPGFELDLNPLSQYNANISVIETTAFDISATKIRQDLKKNIYNAELIPIKVINYIKANNLYKETDE